MKETQHTISDWAVNTFGAAGSNLNIAKKAQEEMHEILEELGENDLSTNAIIEIADVMIVLYHLATDLGCPDIHAVIDEKMTINRTRKWDLKTNRHIE
jgi:hypothetical protein